MTLKITRGLARIDPRLDESLYMGHLESLRDWGHARDNVEMQWLMLQQQQPKEFVIATGRLEGEAAVTLHQLNRRCAPLSEATTPRIQALPLEQLEALADALVDFQGQADLTAWLAAHITSGVSSPEIPKRFGGLPPEPPRSTTRAPGFWLQGPCEGLTLHSQL